MKTQRDLEKLNENVEVKNIDDSVSISLSPRFAVVLLAMIIVVVVAVFAIKNVRKKNSTHSNATQTNAVTEASTKTNSDSTMDDNSIQEENYKLYENGEMAEIEDANGKFKFGVVEATILKETGYRDAVYQITWVTENESYASSMGTGTSAYDLKVVDSDGYIVDAMNSGWEGEWSNNYEDSQPKTGEKCKSKHTFVINNPECTYLDVILDKYKVTCRVNIGNLENGISSIPEGATDKEIEIIKAAQSYVGSCNMSYDGVVQQLEFEGYNNREAVYGADNCGADWNEQAALKAKSYLDGFNFTRDDMIRQLEEGEQFTYEQAVYGADNCGKDW